jgi:hypothetical protein
MKTTLPLLIPCSPKILLMTHLCRRLMWRVCRAKVRYHAARRHTYS